MKKIIVLGSNFAGLTAALETRRKLKKQGVPHSITVVSPSSSFIYVPSLIWVPFGRRKVKDITFKISPVLEKNGISFIQQAAIKIMPDSKKVLLASGLELHYDYLVVSTGVEMKTDSIEGWSENYVDCIVTPPGAQKAYENFKRFIQKPGPFVVGATQGASCMGAAYEYLFNLDKELRRHKIRKKVDLTWITPEPFLGHFGIGGITGGEKMLKTFMKLYNIKWITNAEIKKIHAHKIELKNGKTLPYSMTMLIPLFIGSSAVRNSPEIADDKGFIPCTEGYFHSKYPEIFAAGLAVQVPSPFVNCKVPFGVPKTGFPSDVQGKIVAHNIAHKITGKGALKNQAFGKIPGICIMDAGKKEVVILTNHLFKPRTFEIMIPNVLNHWGKLILEKYMIWKNRLGLSYLP